MLRCPVRVQWYQPRQGYGTDVWGKSWEAAGPWPGVCTGVSTHPLVEWLLGKLENSVISFAVIKTAVKLACLVRNQSGSKHVKGP